jgi:hypothetical protein
MNERVLSSQLAKPEDDNGGGVRLSASNKKATSIKSRSASLIRHPISFTSVARVSASTAGLSQRIREMRGNRIATPDLWRLE